MKIVNTTIPGVHLLEPEIHRDERGEFWRSFCRQECAEYGISFDVCQSNISSNRSQYTLRGFHFQRYPSKEQKILTVVTGSAHVVIVDVRPESPTFLAHVAVTVEPGDRRSVVIASGCATGFLTLIDDTIIHYQMGDAYRPDSYAGFRYDDPAVGVEWPAQPRVISAQDAGFPPLDPSLL
jgi:dTDP-4-dehydrorhamnose 3,5-epimerase